MPWEETAQYSLYNTLGELITQQKIDGLWLHFSLQTFRMFWPAKSKVFIDDCHLNETYQWVVAEHIYNLSPLNLSDSPKN